MQKRLGLVIALTALTTACSGTAPVEATVIEATPAGYVVEVKTLPGLVADISAVKATADAKGVARVVVPLERLSYMKNFNVTHVEVRGRSGLKSLYANVELKLPFTPEEAAKLPSEPTWIRVLGGGPKQVSGGSLWSFGKAGAALMSDDAGITLELLAPPKATVVVLGKSVAVDALGRGSVTFSPEETLGLISSEAVRGGYGSAPDEPVQASVALPGAAAVPVPLAAKWNGVDGKILRPRLVALRDKPLKGARAPAPLVVYLDPTDRLHAEGRAGRLATMDLVAFGTPKPERKMKDCAGYKAHYKGKAEGEAFSLPRVGIDEEVVVVDTHSGKEVGRQLFPADDYCPIEKPKSAAALQVRPNRDTILAWARKL
jgi:hypothetical protein